MLFPALVLGIHCAPAGKGDLQSQADAAYRAKDYHRAAKGYQQLLSRSSDPRNYLKLAEVKLKLEKQSEAVAVVSSAVRRFPSCSECYELLGLLAIHDREYDRAETLLRNALHFNPENRAARNNLGLIYLDRHEPARAYENYYRVLVLNPDDPVANLTIARICRDYFHDSDCAKRHFRRYVTVHPGGREAIRVRAWLQEQEDSLEGRAHQDSSKTSHASPADPFSSPKGPEETDLKEKAGDREKPFLDPDQAKTRTMVFVGEATAPGSDPSLGKDYAEFYLAQSKDWEERAIDTIQMRVALKYAEEAARHDSSPEVKATLKRLKKKLAKMEEAGKKR